MSPLRFAPPFAFETEEQRREREERRRQQAHQNEVQRFQQRATDFQAKQQQKVVRRQQNIASETNRFQRLAQGFQAQQQQRVAKRREEIGGEVSRFRERAQGFQAEQQEKVNLRRQDIGAEVGAFRRRADDFMRQQQERKAVRRAGTQVLPVPGDPTYEPGGRLAQRFSPRAMLPAGVGLGFSERDAWYDEATDRAMISPELLTSAGAPGILAHEGAHATELGFPDRGARLSRLGETFAELPRPEQKRFFRTVQEVMGQKEGSIENRYGVGGPAELFADIQAVLKRRGSDAVPSALLGVLALKMETTATPTPAPKMAPLPLIQPGYTEAGVRERLLPGLTAEPGPDPLGRAMKKGVEYGVKPAIRAAQYVEEPVAAAALGAVSRAGPLGGPALGPSQQIGETPMERAPIGEELVNPARAWLGDEEEQRKAREVLDEAGLPAAIIAQVITSPLNLLPVAGVTKVDDFVRLLKLAGRATGPARQSIVRSRTFQEAIKGIREAGERGGPRVPRPGEPLPVRGPATEPLWEGVQTPIQKLTNIIKRLKPLRAETEIAKSESLRGKVAAIRRIRERYSGEEAFRRETAALRGPDLPYRAEEELRAGFSQPEIDSMINHVLKHPAAQAWPLEARNAQAALVDMLGGKLPTQGEIALLERYFGKDLAKAVAANRPLGAKAWTTLVDAANLPRTLMASMDVSFPLRQGVMVAVRHPKEWLGNLPDMFKGGFSSRHARLLDEAMSADTTIIQTAKGPRAVSELAADSGLYRAPIGGYGPMMEREEFFLSNLAKKLPLIGRGVAFSERAFITYGNKLRQDIFKNTLLSWTKGNKTVTLEDTKALANLLNRMTGRGTLGPANEYAPLLSAGFFAPRFALSRPQAFMQLFNYKNPRVASLAAQEIVSFVGLGASVLGVVKLSGAADVELDPRSADFGKVKIGNTRIDFWGGNLQWARLVTQLQQQKRKTSTGVVVPASGVDAALRFLRFKGSPPASAAVDWSLGETAIGERFPPTRPGVAGEGDITTEVFRRMAPMAIQDLIEAILEHDATGGFLGALAFGGMGVQTYETRAQAFERVTGKSYDETPAVLRRQIIKQTPELQRFESEEPTESEEIRMQRSQELMPGAQAVLQDREDAGVAYVENRRGIMAKIAGAGEWAFRNLDIKPIGRDNKLLSEYHNVDFMADRNKNGVPGDEEDKRLASEEREAILKRMSAPVQSAIQNPANFFPDDAVVEVETMRNSAIDAIQEVVAIPKYQQLSVEESEEVDDFREELRQETAQIKRDAKLKGYDPDDITFKMVAAHRIQVDRSLKDLVTQAVMAENGEAPLTEERVDKALEYQDVLSIFYPRFLASVLPIEVERHRRLTQEAFARINRY